MRPTAVVLAPLASLLGVGLASAPARAHDAPTGAESGTIGATGATGGTEPTATPSRWQGSILLFDQSITTQTVGVGPAYQSYDPTYEWWVALKPKFALWERGRNAVTAHLWMNAYLELTNSDTTTEEHELLLGPTYLWASYARSIRLQRGYKTAATIGPRFTFPTDKAAYDAGQILGAGAIGSLSQTFPLAGPGARAFSGARLGVGNTYSHLFDRCQAPCDGNFQRLREDLNGLSVPSDLLSGAMIVHDSLSVSLLSELQVTRKLELSLAYIVINYWLYPAPSGYQVRTATGPVTPMTNADPTTYRVNTWLTATLSYDVNDALAISAGYYNLANQLAPYGTRRDPLWSPAARFFLTLTGKLDTIYRHLR
jgi:hypothetical protein